MERVIYDLFRLFDLDPKAFWRVLTRCTRRRADISATPSQPLPVRLPIIATIGIGAVPIRLRHLTVLFKNRDDPSNRRFAQAVRRPEP